MSPQSTMAPINAAAARLLLEWGGKRTPSERAASERVASSTVAGSELGRPVSQSSSGQYTYRHTALSLYLARLLRPIWKRKVIKVTNTVRGLVDSEISDLVLTAVQKDLFTLRTVLNENIQLFTPNPIITSNPPSESDQIEIENANAESKSLKAQMLLITQCIEGIAFVLFLIDSKMSEAVSKYVQGIVFVGSGCCCSVSQSVVPVFAHHDHSIASNRNHSRRYWESLMRPC